MCDKDLYSEYTLILKFSNAKQPKCFQWTKVYDGKEAH